MDESLDRKSASLFFTYIWAQYFYSLNNWMNIDIAEVICALCTESLVAKLGKHFTSNKVLEQ